MSALLEVAGLTVDLQVGGTPRRVLHDVSFELEAGHSLALVGESGSGKSMTARTVARLLPDRADTDGRVVFDGTDVLGLRGRALRDYRSRDVSMIFQDPRAHTNPVRRVGDFLTEALRTNQGMKREAANNRAVQLLADVGIADGPRRMRAYPHELSGGLLQRVMIAATLAVRPRLILADEPTTALDVSTQAEVMTILDELRRDQGIAMLFITHDLDLAAAVCHRTIVMYAGSIVEDEPSARLHHDPLHPYTAALAQCRPDVARTLPRLPAIPGAPLSGHEAPKGCAFAARCVHAQPECEQPQRLREFPVHIGHIGHIEHEQQDVRALVRCCRAEQLRGALVKLPERAEEARS